MMYWVRQDGIITRVQSEIAEESTVRDPIFAHPFHRSEIVGLNLFSFIEGMEVRHLYSMLHRRVLRSAKQMSFDYRCDSPGIRRDMRMSLAPDEGSIRYESVVLKETPRAVPIPDASRDALEFVPICSTCCRYRYPRGTTEWKEIDLFPEEPDMPEFFNFTHGLCDSCYERIMGAAPAAEVSSSR